MGHARNCGPAAGGSETAPTFRDLGGKGAGRFSSFTRGSSLGRAGACLKAASGAVPYAGGMRLLTCLVTALTFVPAHAARVVSVTPVPGHAAGSFGVGGGLSEPLAGGVAWALDGRTVFTFDTTRILKR